MRHDWTAIRAAYVEGVPDDDTTLWLTLDEVAARYGVNANSMRRKAAAEQWVEERAAFQRRIEIDRQQQRSAEVARLGADLDVRALTMARDGMAITAARMQELGMAAQRRIKALSNNQVPADPPVESLELDRISRSAAEFYAMGTKALGEAPKFDISVHADEDVEPEDLRDAESLGIMAILREVGALPPELEDVIDIGAGRLSLVAGDDSFEDLGPAEAASE